MRVILERGKGDINRPRFDGITPVLIAAERNVSPELMKLMIDHGGDLNKLRRVR